MLYPFLIIGLLLLSFLAGIEYQKRRRFPRFFRRKRHLCSGREYLEISEKIRDKDVDTIRDWYKRKEEKENDDEERTPIELAKAALEMANMG